MPQIIRALRKVPSPSEPLFLSRFTSSRVQNREQEATSDLEMVNPANMHFWCIHRYPFWNPDCCVCSSKKKASSTMDNVCLLLNSPYCDKRRFNVLKLTITPWFTAKNHKMSEYLKPREKLELTRVSNLMFLKMIPHVGLHNQRNNSNHAKLFVVIPQYYCIISH